MGLDTDILILGGLDLHDRVNFRKLEGWSWGTYADERSQRRTLRGIASWGPSRRDGWVECGGPVLVEPSRVGDGEQLRLLLRRLHDELAKPQTTLTAVPKGMLAPVTMAVVGDPADVPDDLRFEVGKMPILQLHLWREPFPRLPERVVSLGTLTTPCVADLSSMQGQHPAPLSLTCDAQAAGSDLHSLYLSRVPSEYAAWADSGAWLWRAADQIWSGGQLMYGTLDDGDWKAWAIQGVTSGAMAHITSSIDVAGWPSGPYQVIARAAGSTSSNSVAFDALHGYLPASHPMLNDLNPCFSLVELGEAVLPKNRLSTAYAAASDLRTVALDSVVDVNTRLLLQWVAFLPMRWGFRRYHRSAASGAKILQSDGDTFFVDGEENVGDVCGAGLEALGGRLLIASEDHVGDSAAHAASVSYSYAPRLTLW